MKCCSPLLASSLTCLLFLVGCAARTHTPYAGVGAELGDQPSFVKDTGFTTVPLEYSNTIALETNDYVQRSVTFRPTAMHHAPFSARYYQGKLPGTKPLVIILPVWGVSAYPSNAVANNLLERRRGSLNVLVVEGENYLLDWQRLAEVTSEAEFVDVIRGMVGQVKRKSSEVRGLLEWARSREEIDPQRVALIGFSVSGHVATLTLMYEPSVAASVIVMGGGHPHQMMARCADRIARTREQLTARLGWSVEEYERKLEKLLVSIDPLVLNKRLDGKKTLMIDAAKDTCVSPEARERLWAVLGNPERISYHYDHKMAFLAMTPLGLNVMRREISRFLEKTLP